MKCGIILVILFSLLVGISSGIFDGMVNEPSSTSFGIFEGMANEPSSSSFGIFDDPYTPFNLYDMINNDWKPFHLYDGLVNNTWKPFNLYDWLNPQPEPEKSVDPLPAWPPLPVLPEPTPLSTQEITNMQSKLTSMKNVLYFG